MRVRSIWVALTAAAAVFGIVALTTASGAPTRVRTAFRQQCSSSDTTPHNPANPLNTAGFTGTDPLDEAHLFVESPWLFGGDAANAIATLVGRGSLTRQTSGTPIPWARFEAQVNAMHLSPSVSTQVHELEKIGDYAQPHQFSVFTAGGSGNAIYTQVQNYLCRMQRTDPAAAAVITTYFVKHGGGCHATTNQNPKFTDEVNALKAAVGNFSALIFVEEDAIDTICFRNPAAVRLREKLLKQEIDTLSTIPHALLYVEGGTADGTSVKNAVRVLRAIDAKGKIRGFYLGDTHFNWAYKEIQFGNKVARKTGLHFVVDSRADGQGPIKNRNPVKQGNERLCNPPHRGLGPHPGASNGAAYGMFSKYLDGFVWVTTPGESTAPTCPGFKGHWGPSGIFDPSIGLDLAEHANNRIGPPPRFKSEPY